MDEAFVVFPSLIVTTFRRPQQAVPFPLLHLLRRRFMLRARLDHPSHHMHQRRNRSAHRPDRPEGVDLQQFRVSETDSEQIEKVSPFYVSLDSPSPHD